MEQVIINIDRFP